MARARRPGKRKNNVTAVFHFLTAPLQRLSAPLQRVLVFTLPLLLCAPAANSAEYPPHNSACDPVTDTGELVRKFRLSAPLESIRLGLPMLDAEVPELERAVIAFDVAYAYAENGEFQRALELLQPWLQRMLALKHDACIAHAYASIGSVYFIAEDYEDALTWTQKALDLRQKVGNEDRVAGSLNNIGNIYLELKSTSRATEYYQLAREKWRKVNNVLKAAMATSNLGYVDLIAGRYESAVQHQDETLPVFEAEDEHYSVAEAQLFAAQALLELGRAEDALARVEAGFTRAEKQNLLPLMIRLALVRARVLVRLGRSEEAEELVIASMASMAGERQVRARQQAWEFLADLYQQRGDHVRALAAFRQHHDLSQKMYSRIAAVKLASASLNYELNEKENQIQRLRAEKEIAELEFSRQKYARTVWLFAATGVLLFLGMMLVIYVHRREIRRQRLLNERLAQLDKAKDQVLANTSHELRTPLNGIIGLSELVLESELPAEVRSYSQMILDSGRRLAKVVEDLLEFSRLKQDKVELALAPVELQPAVALAVKMCAPLLSGKALRVSNEVALDLPAVRADYDRLQQILVNLISNAIKFTEHGTVRIVARVDESAMRVEVIDTGPGIAVEHQQRIFESFEQADGTMTRRHEGLGLGLAITRRLVLMHAGSIGVESQPGRGSAFWFTLPLAEM